MTVIVNSCKIVKISNFQIVNNLINSLFVLQVMESELYLERRTEQINTDENFNLTVFVCRT